MTIRDQLVLGLRPGVVQQELQRQVRRTPTLTFTEVCSEVKALEAELKMEPVCASRISVPQPNPSMVAPSLEEWRETVRAELRQEFTDQFSVLKETLTDEIKTRPYPLGGLFGKATTLPPLGATTLWNGMTGANQSAEAVGKLVTSRGTVNRGGGS